MEEIVIIDIETGGAAGPLFEYEQSLVSHHANTKDKKKQADQIRERSTKLVDESALSDCAPVIIIGTVSQLGTVIFASCKKEEITLNVQNMTILPCESERGILLCFSHFLSIMTQPVNFIGHHVETRGEFKGFDLPHIRFRYAVNDIEMPESLHPLRTKSVDTMSLYWRSSNTKDPFVRLEVIGRKLGIISELFPLTGRDVPGLWERGEYQQCLLKNLYDLRLTEQVYRRLSGEV
jgi:hypothetical protein